MKVDDDCDDYDDDDDDHDDDKDDFYSWRKLQSINHKT